MHHDPFDDVLYDLSGTVGMAPGQTDRLQRLLVEHGAPQRILNKAARLAAATDSSQGLLREIEEELQSWQQNK